MSFSSNHRGQNAPSTITESINDPVEAMLERTGCAKENFNLHMCMADKKDWRKCQDLVKQLKECMQKNSK